ncbi:MAG: hypothetical protein ACE5GO_07500 [Anaerolineales bacterium]
MQNAPQTATINVTYLGSWNQPAKDAFEFAVSIWETQITSSVPIEVEANWANLGSGILGGAGASELYRDFSNAPQANTWYPVALANKLAGSDLDSGPDIDASFNSTFSSWYFGTDGSPPTNQYDFISVVLHEIGHGLGFFGTMTVDAAAGGTCGGVGLGCWGYGTGFPGIYDLFTENGSGVSLLSFPNNSAQLAAELTSDNVFFDGPLANAANGGAPVELYAPSTWQQGSSYSHLGEVFNGTSNSLMTYSIGPGEVEHNPGPVMLGMFEDMGWAIAGPPTATPTLGTMEPHFLPLINLDATPTPTPSSSSWQTIVQENFEGSFPGNWQLSDNTGGAYQWGQRNCRQTDGASSGWAIGGGSTGSTTGCGGNYPGNAEIWMTYGPFSLSDANFAQFSIEAWVYTEKGLDDLCHIASTTGGTGLSSYDGWCYSGDTQGWMHFDLDLTTLPALGDITGYPNVWVALVFRSDSTNTFSEGAFVDEIVVRKCTASCQGANMINTIPNGATFEIIPWSSVRK